MIKEQLKLKLMLRCGMNEIEAEKRIEETERHSGIEGLNRLGKALKGGV